MELHLSHEDGYVIASTSGAIDDSARTLFREHLHPLVQQKGTKMVLDLSQSKLINSMGIGQLVALVADANTNSSRVVLAACSPFIAIVLTRSKLDKFFNMAATLPEAIQACLDG